jgi:hypothetical protein
MYVALCSLISVERIPSHNKLDRGYVVGRYKFDENTLRRYIMKAYTALYYSCIRI